ncbi:hypothetical protein VE03_04139 [Pseudogymnoascus sp. 23342-1-I1]|nr:hypothetical protein VE03_04139 [Pseudogymnoascus sp. 23342-1-I1]
MATENIQKFHAAMEAVYGSLKGGAVELWIPPPKSGGHRGRYLWTDAFGVVNFLTLHKELQDERYLTFAKRLAVRVHTVLGSTRDGQSRLPGATAENPLGGGLRIGKEEEGGLDGDGQYHHYLTLWMFALNRLSIASSMPIYNDQAIALARAIHPKFFIDRESASPRMVWKVSMDMSRPLVSSQGRLDATTGYVVYRLLQAAAEDPRALETEIADYQKSMRLRDSVDATHDTLDLGMALWIAHWYAGKDEWAQQLEEIFGDEKYKTRAVPHRLAFREFGALMGAKCYTHDVDVVALVDSVIEVWGNFIDTTVEDLKPITMVMYAAAMIPTAFQKNGLGPEPGKV